MNATVQSLFVLLVCAGVMLPAAHAQAPAAPLPVPDGPRYIVTYLEVTPTATADALKLVRQLRDAVRKETGNLRAEALQRIGQAHQFVLLEAWQDQVAADTHAKATATIQFRDKIRTIQNAPIDERTHFALSVGPIAATAGKTAVAIVTHVDVIPPRREDGTALTRQLADDARKHDGNLRSEAVTQVNRQNHFTVIQLWRDRKAADAHGMAMHTRAYRDKLGPMNGALYDERFYAVLD